MKTKRVSTMFLRGVVVVLGIVALSICIFLLTVWGKEDASAYRPIFLGMYFAAVPFYIALFQTMKLLDYIDRNKAFSKLSVNILTIIKKCAVIISAIFTLLSPYIYIRAELDDAPGLFAIALVIIGASVVIAVFAAVLQRILEDAIRIKSENDLTV